MTQWAAFFFASQRSFWRERSAVFWTFAMPVLLLGIMGPMFGERAAFARISVSDSEDQRWGAALRDRIRAAGWEARDPTRADAVVAVRPGGPADAAPGEGSALVVDYRAEGRVQRLAIYSFLGAIVHQANRDAGAPLPLQLPEPAFLVADRGSADGYADYLLRGLVGLNVFSIALFGLGVGIAWQRELGILRQLWLTPARPGAYLTAQLASTALIIFASTAWLVAVGQLWLDVAAPRWLPFSAVLVVGSLALAPLGLAIAARSGTPRTAQLWANLIYFPLMLLSGVYFRPDRLGESVAAALDWSPLKPFLDALRAAGQGASLAALGDELAVLGAWGGAGLLLARGIFRWNQ